MRVLIYGGREFGTTKEEVKLGVAFLDKCAEGWPHYECDIYGNTLPDVTVISGGAKGADTLGIHWATINWTGLEVFPADWERHGKAAGHIRNQLMLDSGVDVAVQFPGGKGTADMRRRLDKAGVKVIEYPQ